MLRFRDLGEERYYEMVSTDLSFTDFLCDRLFATKICVLCTYGVLLDEGDYKIKGDKNTTITVDRGLPVGHFSVPTLFSSDKTLNVWTCNHYDEDMLDVVTQTEKGLLDQTIPNNIYGPVVCYSAFRAWEHSHVTAYDLSSLSTLETPHFIVPRVTVNCLTMRLLVTMISWISKLSKSNKVFTSTMLVLPRPLGSITSLFESCWHRGHKHEALLCFIALNTLRRLLYTLSIPDHWSFLIASRNGNLDQEIIFNNWLVHMKRLFMDGWFIGLTSSSPLFEIHPDVESKFAGMVDTDDFIVVDRPETAECNDVISTEFLNRVVHMFD
jgi:hypothetical protein